MKKHTHTVFTIPFQDFATKKNKKEKFEIIMDACEIANFLASELFMHQVENFKKNTQCY